MQSERHTQTKREHRPVQTSSQHVKFLFYLPCSAWQQLAQHDHESLTEVFFNLNTILGTLCDVTNVIGVLQGFSLSGRVILLFGINNRHVKMTSTVDLCPFRYLNMVICLKTV